MTELIIDNITISYNHVIPIISNFSFIATSGDVVLLEGRNGSGKTTILKSIAGIIKPIKGNIYINGNDIFSISHSKRKTIVSFAQQSPMYSSPIKVLEFLEMALPLNNSYLVGWRRIKKFVKLLEIEELLLEPINTLSEGQKKLILLCRTFIQDSKVILLDEPEAFLDTYNQKLLINTIKEVINEEKVIIFVSHNQSFSSELYNKKIQIISNSQFILSEKEKILY